MLNIALELAKHRRIYEDIASKFFEHFILIIGRYEIPKWRKEKSLWNDEDGFYYDAISWGGPWTQQTSHQITGRLIPLYAALTLEPELINKFPSFKRASGVVHRRIGMMWQNEILRQHAEARQGRETAPFLGQSKERLR